MFAHRADDADYAAGGYHAQARLDAVLAAPVEDQVVALPVDSLLDDVGAEVAEVGFHPDGNAVERAPGCLVARQLLPERKIFRRKPFVLYAVVEESADIVAPGPEPGLHVACGPQDPVSLHDTVFRHQYDGEGGEYEEQEDGGDRREETAAVVHRIRKG